MIQKIEHLFKKYWPYVYELRDVRVAGLIVFGVVVLLISWSGVKAIDTNYQLQRQISRLQQEAGVQKLSNENAQLQNDYFKTQQYLDLSARQNFGLALPGETEVLVPQATALRNTVKQPALPGQVKVAAKKQSKLEKNFQAWVNFFLHRQSSVPS